MEARTRTAWLVAGVAVVGIALIAALFLVPALGGSDAEEPVARHHQHSQHSTSQNTDEYWTSERMREAEPATGGVEVDPVPYVRLGASAVILILTGGTIGWLIRRQRRA